MSERLPQGPIATSHQRPNPNPKLPAFMCYCDLCTDERARENACAYMLCPFAPMERWDLDEYGGMELDPQGVWVSFEDHEDAMRRLRERLERPAREPIEIFACGPSSLQCKCECVDGGACEHVWDGPEIEDGNCSSATCSVCSMWAINHDMWVMP